MKLTTNVVRQGARMWRNYEKSFQSSQRWKICRQDILLLAGNSLRQPSDDGPRSAGNILIAYQTGVLQPHFKAYRGIRLRDEALREPHLCEKKGSRLEGDV